MGLRAWVFREWGTILRYRWMRGPVLTQAGEVAAGRGRPTVLGFNDQDGNGGLLDDAFGLGA